MTSIRRLKWLNHNRRGAILVLTAVVMVFVLALAAFALDLSYLSLTKTQLQGAADAAALAGALELSGSADSATVRANALAAAQDVASYHHNGDKASLAIDSSDVTFGKMSWNSATNKYTTAWGNSESPYNVIKVRASREAGGGASPDNRLPLFFAPIIGHDKGTIGAEATATFKPRDIMIVLDFSSSMNDDSCFGRISTLGRTYIESNLLTMWQELGSPIYGNLTFTPNYATLRGIAASGTIPHIDVIYKRSSVTVASTMGISQVRLQFSGTTQVIPVNGSQTGTFSGSGTSAGKDITKCWVLSGTNASLSAGNYGEQFDFTAANIKTALGLDIAYPYAYGSWAEYIATVQALSGEIKDAGYRDMFGYMTWINYLQTNRPSKLETADLWKTSEQPLGALKDSVAEFMNYLTDIEAQDHVGLVIYTHSNSTGAILEHGLGTSLSQILSTTQQRQAGHYNGSTHISGGMKIARQEIEANARPDALRVMVVMTDGLPNLPTNISVATAATIAEANSAKASNIKILAISLGVLADTVLMQQIADITGGVHYNVPGGTSIDTVRAQLQQVFRDIAGSRPLKLVNAD
jgi:von Willebrand factor type A domain-containing protein/putative Flp pilus-assembly TadE/G-like protein